ncbi:MAG TPA: hypothetical protein VI876_04705 [Dehalococcoidia bacterium]|nr:hypothetical protein [Dehalococcoidia bacterium]
MKSYQEMAREAEEVKDSERELEGLVPVKARVAKTPRAVYSVRLSFPELTEITQAAKQRDMTVSDFMRQASLSASQGYLGLDAGRQEAALLAVRERARELYEAVEKLEAGVDKETPGQG